MEMQNNQKPMDKKIFETPQMEIILFSTNDIITTSSYDINDVPYADEDEEPE